MEALEDAHVYMLDAEYNQLLALHPRNSDERKAYLCVFLIVIPTPFVHYRAFISFALTHPPSISSRMHSRAFLAFDFFVALVYLALVIFEKPAVYPLPFAVTASTEIACLVCISSSLW